MKCAAAFCPLCLFKCDSAKNVAAAHQAEACPPFECQEGLLSAHHAVPRVDETGRKCLDSGATAGRRMAHNVHATGTANCCKAQLTSVALIVGHMLLQQAQQAATKQCLQHCPRPWGSQLSRLLHPASRVTWVVGLVEAPHSMSPGVIAISAQVIAGQPPTGGALVAAALDGE